MLPAVCLIARLMHGGYTKQARTVKQPPVKNSSSASVCMCLLVQVVKVVELLVAAVPASPALVQLLLQLLPRFPGDRALSWLLPLLVGALCKSTPAAPASDWVAVVQLAARVSPAAAAAVARRGAETHPWSKQLWHLHVETQGGRQCGQRTGGGRYHRRTAPAAAMPNVMAYTALEIICCTAAAQRAHKQPCAWGWCCSWRSVP